MSLIPINRANVPHVNHRGAFESIGQVQGRDAQIIIWNFGKDTFTEPLFFPNSREWEKVLK